MLLENSEGACGVVVDADARALGRLFSRLGLGCPQAEMPDVFRAALDHDDAALERLAARAGVEPDGFRARAALAEICGVERRRYLRCGGCGCGWRAWCLACPYCGTSDHEALASLVAERAWKNAAIETCRHCLGYLKAFTKLRAGEPAQVMIEDLATVELDLAAAERGYGRPPGSGFALAVALGGAA